MFRATLALLLFPLAAAAADDGRVSFLEQEVRELKRQVMALDRRLDEATMRPDRLAIRERGPTTPSSAAISLDWVDAAKWRKLHAGMSELEVVGVLGAPTSMRDLDGARVLFYALEIGTSGFLGGSVKFRGRALSEIQTPVLQ